jgi:hypothetical protein
MQSAMRAFHAVAVIGFLISRLCACHLTKDPLSDSGISGGIEKSNPDALAATSFSFPFLTFPSSPIFNEIKQKKNSLKNIHERNHIILHFIKLILKHTHTHI